MIREPQYSLACVGTNSITLLLLSSFFLSSFKLDLADSLTSRGEWIFSRPIWYSFAYSYLSPFLHVNYKQLNGLANRYNQKVNRLLFAWMLAFLQEKEKLEMEKSEGESIKKFHTENKGSFKHCKTETQYFSHIQLYYHI